MHESFYDYLEIVIKNKVKKKKTKQKNNNSKVGIDRWSFTSW